MILGLDSVLQLFFERVLDVQLSLDHSVVDRLQLKVQFGPELAKFSEIGMGGQP